MKTRSVLVFLVLVVFLISVFVSAEMTEAEKKAYEAAKKAAEGKNGGGNGNGGTITTGKLNGRISDIDLVAKTFTVGIIGDTTFKVTSKTKEMKFNGQISNLYRMHIGDKISVKYDTVTRDAISVEAEGQIWGAAIYKNKGLVTYVGLIGHIPGRSYGMHAAGHGVKLGPEAQVTINSVPATYQDIKVGDTADFVQSSLDLKAMFVKITR